MESGVPFFSQVVFDQGLVTHSVQSGALSSTSVFILFTLPAYSSSVTVDCEMEGSSCC